MPATRPNRQSPLHARSPCSGSSSRWKTLPCGGLGLKSGCTRSRRLTISASKDMKRDAAAGWRDSRPREHCRADPREDGPSLSSSDLDRCGGTPRQREVLDRGRIQPSSLRRSSSFPLPRDERTGHDHTRVRPDPEVAPPIPGSDTRCSFSSRPSRWIRRTSCPAQALGALTRSAQRPARTVRSAIVQTGPLIQFPPPRRASAKIAASSATRTQPDRDRSTPKPRRGTHGHDPYLTMVHRGRQGVRHAGLDYRWFPPCRCRLPSGTRPSVSPGAAPPEQ